MVECLPSLNKTLGSIASTIETKKQNNNNKLKNRNFRGLHFENNKGLA
jgi:hypothetical protein